MSTHSNPFINAIGMTCVAGALALGALSGCDQQGVSCATAHGAFAVKLTLSSGTGVCAESAGGVYGLATYNYTGRENRPDLNRSSMAIQAEEFGVLVGDAEARLGETFDPNGKMYARGDFSAPEPNGNQVCEVPTLVKASKDIPTQPAIPAVPAVPDDPATAEDESEAEVPAVPAVPATSYAYEWSDLKFLVSAANQGTRFTGTLKYKVDGCTAEYQAVGLYPAVSCANEDGNPVDGLCSAEPVAALGMVTGSGISPDFTTKCDPDLLLCVLAERPATD